MARSFIAISTLLMLQSLSDLPSCMLLTGSVSYSFRDIETSPSEEDCSYLGNLSGPSLEKKLATLAQFTWGLSVSLALGGVGRWEALWFDQQRAEK